MSEKLLGEVVTGAFRSLFFNEGAAGLFRIAINKFEKETAMLAKLVDAKFPGVSDTLSSAYKNTEIELLCREAGKGLPDLRYCVQCTVRNGTKLLSKRDEFGNTPAYYALRNPRNFDSKTGRNACFEYIVDNTNNLSTALSVDLEKRGETPTVLEILHQRPIYKKSLVNFVDTHPQLLAQLRGPSCEQFVKRLLDREISVIPQLQDFSLVTLVFDIVRTETKQKLRNAS